MTRVLYVGIGAPWEGGAGFLVRQNMFLRALAECASLHLAMLDSSAPASAAPFPCELTSLPYPARVTQSRLGSLWSDLFSSRPSMLRELDCAATRATLRELEPDRFDAVFAYRPDFAYFAGVLDHPRLILDIDDPEHLRRREAYALLPAQEQTWLRRRDIARLRRFERNAVRGALAAFVCQKRDQQAFSQPQPLVAPNCVEAPPACPARRADRPSIVFLGNLQGSPQSPNVDGLRWFLREVWPLVRAESPACMLRIVGGISDSLRAEFGNVAGVHVLGHVTSVESELVAASLTIAPIRFGTGTRIKILHSMAWGCPVVSTVKGAEGLGIVNEQHALLADQPPVFAEACLRLLHDEALQRRLGEAGHRLVVEHYDLERNRQRLVSVLANLIQQTSGRSIDRRMRDAA